MSIRVLLSVELCVTLKTYLKGAPFYNASCWRRCAARERCLRSDLREARFRWLTMLDLSRYEFNERPR
jgi:hypothetical protein